jgi:UDP-glucose 6-dehydrogenase
VLVSSGLGTLAGDDGVLFSPWALGCVCIDKDKQCITELKDGQMPFYERGLTAAFISTEPRPGNRSAQTTQRHQLE